MLEILELNQLFSNQLDMSESDLSTIIMAADELFILEDYERAIPLYQSIVQKDHCNGPSTLNLATCYNKCNINDKALIYAKEAVLLMPNNSEVYKQRGISEFKLKLFSEAYNSFNTANNIQPSTFFKTWMRKCELESGTNKSVVSAPIILDSKTAVDTKPTIKKDFYQSDMFVTLCIFVKNIKRENVKIVFEEKNLDVSILLADNNEYAMDIELFGNIVVGECKYDVLSTKIEIKMKKKDMIKWLALEATDDIVDTGSNSKYPSSSKRQIDWTAFNPDLGEDTRGLWQKMYDHEDDDGRKAMEKSFTESGGTVLNANWKKVGKKTVKPCVGEGGELKQWRDLHH